MTWAVLATGPSLTQEDVDAVRGLPVVAVNDAYKLAPWAKCLHASDQRWWALHPEALKHCGEKSALEPVGGVVQYTPSDAILEDRAHYLATGRNSGYQAINIAIHKGARRVLLLGFDMRRVDGKSHFFGSHPRSLERQHPYAAWLERFEELADITKARGIEIINCTPRSALKCFPTMRLSDALQEVRGKPETA